MRIGIDLDICVIQSDQAWYEWLQHMCGGQYEFTPWHYFKEKILKEEGAINYNLTKYFPEPRDGKSDPMDFWRSISTYDTIKAVKDSVEAIKSLHNNGHEIVFISALKGHSHRSKYNWLLRHFDFEFAFIGTKEKYLVNVDVMIDDRLNNLEEFDSGVKKIWYDSPYTQFSTKYRVTDFCKDWGEVLEKFD